MQNKLVTVFSCVIFLSAGALAEDDIKRGTYPFMAFIYYQDDTILGLGGGRFLQGAVLVRPSFLISSSPESSISDDPLSKTLQARLGATVIDPKFTLNEDEDEQEREIIQITRPSEHNKSQWWLTDICLLKTLLPFLTTNAVKFTQLSTKQEAADKVCHILVFKKKSGTDVRVLTRLFVEILPGSVDSCGEHFVHETMMCAADQATSDGTQPAGDFCRGNNGGPLLCDNDVIALQTYTNDDCKAPHLYQLLSPRKRFLDCGIDEKCDKEHCKHVCTVIQKDSPPLAPRVSETVATETTKLTTSTQATTVTTSTQATTVTEPTKTPELIETVEATFATMPTTTPTLTTTTTSTPTKSWPNERDGRRMNDEEDPRNRTVSVEAQSRSDDVEPKRAGRSHGNKNVNLVLFHSFVYSSFLLCVL